MGLAVLGDDAAYATLMARLSILLKRFIHIYANRFQISDADRDDIVQETLITIHRRRTLWNPDLPLLPWARVILRNKVIDHVRRRARRRETSIDLTSTNLALVAPEKFDGIGDRYDIERALLHLSKRSRQVVALIALDGYSPRELAARFGVTENAVRIALHRGLKSISAAYSSPNKDIVSRSAESGDLAPSDHVD